MVYLIGLASLDVASWTKLHIHEAVFLNKASDEQIRACEMKGLHQKTLIEAFLNWKENK